MPPARARFRLPWRLERPVFIIAPPRSGSTFLFECLARFPELHAFTDREGTYLWRFVLPFHKRAEVSDAITPEEFGPWRRRQLRTLLYGRTVVKDYRLRPDERLARLVRQPAMRYLDKSIANTFRVPLLAEMFPDATFVQLVRDPRTNIASMIEGWSWPHFQKRKLAPYLEEAGTSLPNWTYAAAPGWRDVLDRSLPEVCAWSWQQHAEAILRWRETADDPGPLVHYEDLVSDPVGVVRGLAERLDLTVTDEIVDYLAHPPQSRTTLPRSSPERRAEVAQQVADVLPQVGATAARLGYRTEP